jgi:YHS domain-containing protein
VLHTKLIFAAVGLLPVALILIGCGKSTTPSASPKSLQPTNQAHSDATTQSNQDAQITAALAELTVEDRAQATKQKNCPVSGELLGSMGAPLKIDVKGQSVFICCEGCKDKLLATPDEYLAKLKQ